MLLVVGTIAADYTDTVTIAADYTDTVTLLLITLIP